MHRGRDCFGGHAHAFGGGSRGTVAEAAAEAILVSLRAPTTEVSRIGLSGASGTVSAIAAQAVLVASHALGGGSRMAILVPSRAPMAAALRISSAGALGTISAAAAEAILVSSHAPRRLFGCLRVPWAAARALVLRVRRALFWWLPRRLFWCLRVRLRRRLRALVRWGRGGLFRRPRASSCISSELAGRDCF